MAYVLTFGELIGGALLIVGLLTRLTAVYFIVEMILAIILVKIDVGLIAPMGQGAGAELDLALIAALAAVATFGPGSLSVDRNMKFEARRLAVLAVREQRDVRAGQRREVGVEQRDDEPCRRRPVSGRPSDAARRLAASLYRPHPD